MTEQEAKLAAAKRIKVETAIAVTAGVTVGACAAWYAKNKWSETYCDQVLKAGTTFHNLDSAANPRPGEHLYVNYRQNDVNYFRGHFAVNKMRKTGQVFNHTITSTEDIKIPSLNTRKNTFKQLYNEDKQFREAFEKHIYGKTLSNDKFTNPFAGAVYKQMWKNFGDKDTEDFNIAKRKYFDALRQKGYEAIVDEWDTSKGVFRSDAPLILLNTSSKSLGEMSIKELSNRDILLSQANSRNYKPIRDALNSILAPHTNHFKESDRGLSRYSDKISRNSDRIDTVLSKLSDEDASKYVRSRKGALLSDAGKYMLKNNSLSAEAAINKAKAKSSRISAASTAATVGLTMLGSSAVSNVNKNRYVREYIKEHPNTKLSYNQIKQMYGYNDNVRKYIEDNPDKQYTSTELLKKYYGLDKRKW